MAAPPPHPLPKRGSSALGPSAASTLHWTQPGRTHLFNVEVGAGTCFVEVHAVLSSQLQEKDIPERESAREGRCPAAPGTSFCHRTQGPCCVIELQLSPFPGTWSSPPGCPHPKVPQEPRWQAASPNHGLRLAGAGPAWPGVSKRDFPGQPASSLSFPQVLFPSLSPVCPWAWEQKGPLWILSVPL